MNDNDRPVEPEPESDPPGLDRIPSECDRCGATWLWCINEPDTMRCPDCRDIVPAAEVDEY